MAENERLYLFLLRRNIDYTAVTKLITYIIALQILNMSICVPYPQAPYSTADNFNYIDTYIEYIAEVVLKYENAIPESKHRQHKELQQHHHLVIILKNTEQPAVIGYYQKQTKQRVSYNDRYPYQFIKEINPPPPKLS